MTTKKEALENATDFITAVKDSLQMIEDTTPIVIHAMVVAVSVEYQDAAGDTQYLMVGGSEGCVVHAEKMHEKGLAKAKAEVIAAIKELEVPNLENVAWSAKKYVH